MKGEQLSCVPGIEWPALPTAAGATMLAMQFQLERSQWWPAERIVAQQFRQLRTLVDHAVREVPHYRELFAQHKLPTGAALTPDTLRQWPILQKAALVEGTARLRAAHTPKEHGGIVESATTGSTGHPVRLAFTEAAQFVTHALALRHFLWHEFDLAGKLCIINPHLEERALPDWGALTGAAFQTGPAALLDIGTDVKSQLDWLIRERPAYLQTRPSNLRALAQLGRESGRVPPGIRAVTTQSEMLPEGLRNFVADTWRAKIVDTYSCGEFGTLALQCPEHEHYHVQSESAILEILHEDDTPCGPGDTGRVVVTSLHNFALPLIRYELGDYARVGGACACGRGLPVLERIAGRVRNLAQDPSGRRFWPSFFAPLWLEVAPFRQIQLVQHTPARIEVRYVLDRDLSPREQAAMRERLHGSLAYPYDIAFTRVDAIARRPGEKFEDFVSLIETP